MIDEEARIGGVWLNFKHYSGLDLYSDGKIEDEILNIVQRNAPEDFPAVIENRESWPVLYHLSEQRANIIEWMPITKDDKVLEVGSGCGAITGALAEKAGSVTCVDLSKKRSQINATRNQNRSNITIHVGNFRDIEPDLDTDFDYIFLIGVFEYGQGYMGEDHPYEMFLNLLRRHLSRGGRIVIAIENRLGLKYFAGCKEDHLATYFSGIEGYTDDSVARTFTRNGLIRIFKACGIQEYHFYYPYPDYKFMTLMHSDSYHPHPGEMMDNVHNFDNDRMVLFNEKKAYDAIIADGMYPEFANSFLVVLGPGFDTVYTKYSNDRVDEFKIRTDICLETSDRLIVRKVPLTTAARDHIHNIHAAYVNLIERFRGGDLEVNDCQVDIRSCTAMFTFVHGVPLSELMDQCLFKNDMDAFLRLFKEYLHRISYKDNYPVADYDLIFPNIMVNGPIWTIIDYEWTYGKCIPPREIAFRAIHNYVLEDRRRASLDVQKLYNMLGLTESDINTLLEEEAGFQKYVTGNRMSMVELWLKMGGKQIIPKELDLGREAMPKVEREKPADNVIQLYQDLGQGYDEARSIFPKITYDENGQVTLVIGVDQTARAVRIDPAFKSCMVNIKQVLWNTVPLGGTGAGLQIKPNGTYLSPDTIVFATNDPFIEFRFDNAQVMMKPQNRLSVTFAMSLMPMQMAEKMIADARTRSDELFVMEQQREMAAARDLKVNELQKTLRSITAGAPAKGTVDMGVPGDVAGKKFEINADMLRATKTPAAMAVEEAPAVGETVVEEGVSSAPAAKEAPDAGAVTRAEAAAKKKVQEKQVIEEDDDDDIFDESAFEYDEDIEEDDSAITKFFKKLIR